MMKLSWLSAMLLVAKAATAVAPVSAVGNKFFTPDGKQFFVKGMRYSNSKTGIFRKLICFVQESRIS